MNFKNEKQIKFNFCKVETSGDL